MYCTNCGKEVREGAKFCNHCGAELKKPILEEQQVPPEKPKKKKSKLIPIVAALCVCLLAGGGALYFSSRDKAPEPTGSESAEASIVPERQGEDASFNGHKYHVYDVDEVSSWDDAKLFCEKQGGHLATITSQEENDFLNNYINECGIQTAYFGLSDAKKEGEWEWVTGEKVSYTNWYPKEPNNADDGENEAGFYFKSDSNGRWFDGRMGTSNGGKAFICEWDNDDAAATPQVTAKPDPTQDLFQEYAKVVKSYEDQYGKAATSEDPMFGTTSFSGLFYINLMDMNLDSIEELILCYDDPVNMTCYADIWSFDGKSAVQLNEKEVGTGITSCMGTQDGGKGILFSKLDGEWVFVSGFDFQFRPWDEGIARNVSHSGSTFELYAVRGNKFERIHSAEYPQDGIPTVDGKEVSADDYNATVEAWTATQQVINVGFVDSGSDDVTAMLSNTESIRRQLGVD